MEEPDSQETQAIELLLSPPEKRAPGRPSKYSPALAAEICRRVADKRSISSVGRDADMPDRFLIHIWLKRHSEFRNMMDIAQQIRTEAIDDECFEIADETAVNIVEVSHARLKIDQRYKWLASVSPRHKTGPQVSVGVFSGVDIAKIRAGRPPAEEAIEAESLVVSIDSSDGSAPAAALPLPPAEEPVKAEVQEI